MTISEFIAELEKVQTSHGDLEVRIQWGDGGGCYPGTGKVDKESLCIETSDYDANKKDLVLVGWPDD